MNKLQECCESMYNELQYGEAIEADEEKHRVYMRSESGITSIRFCPFCGKELEITGIPEPPKIFPFLK